MSPRRRKILGYFALFLSVDVFIAAILALISTWVGLSATNSLLVNLFEAGTRVTGVADKALAQVDTTMANFQVKAQNLSSDVAQIGQNVADQGVIKTLLTPDKEAAFTETFDQIRQTAAQVQDAVAGVRSFMQALGNLPFVQIPQYDNGPLQKLNDLVQQLGGLVQQVKQGVEDLRAGITTSLQTVANALSEISNAVLESRMNLATVRAYVQSANLVILPFLTAFSPIFFLFIALILTILYGWTIYVMFRMIRWSNAWRKGASPTLLPNPAAPGVEPAAAPPSATPPAEAARLDKPA